MFNISLRVCCATLLLVLSSCSSSDFAGMAGGSASSNKTPSVIPTSVPVSTGTPDPNQGSLLGNEGRLCQDNQPGYGGKVYQLPAGTANLPDFSKMTPVGQIDAPQLNVPTRDFTSGFPGVPNLIEWFGIRFFAVFDVAADNDYMFRTSSDDGSKLYIDDALVLNNDGTHGSQTRTSGTVHLVKGTHKLVVEWFQGPKVEIALQVYWKVGADSWAIIPNSALTHSDLCDVTKIGSFGN